MKKSYAILNTFVILAVIAWNYIINTGIINGKTVGEISDKYQNLFTPAGYAFSIWGIIFLGLLVLSFSQLRSAFKKGDQDETILQIGPWLIIANLGNAAWLWCWLSEQTGITVLVMAVILVSLLRIVYRLNMEKHDASMRIIATVWWPISIYAGWITVAAIANISAWLTKLNWHWLFTDIQWTIIMISIAAILNLLIIYTRNMREFAAVGVWAIIAIGVRHWDEIVMIQWVCVFWAAVLLISILLHAYKNRDENPFNRLFEGSRRR